MTEPFTMLVPTLKCSSARPNSKATLSGDQRREMVFSQTPALPHLLVMVVAQPDAPPHQKMSMFLVPSDTPGVNIVRNVGLGTEHSNEDARIGWMRAVKTCSDSAVKGLKSRRHVSAADAFTTPCARWDE